MSHMAAKYLKCGPGHEEPDFSAGFSFSLSLLSHVGSLW